MPIKPRSWGWSQIWHVRLSQWLSELELWPVCNVVLVYLRTFAATTLIHVSRIIEGKEKFPPHFFIGLNIIWNSVVCSKRVMFNPKNHPVFGCRFLILDPQEASHRNFPAIKQGNAKSSSHRWFPLKPQFGSGISQLVMELMTPDGI